MSTLSTPLLHYHQTHTTGPHVVMLHGWMATKEIFTPLHEQLEDHILISPDLRSTWDFLSDYSLESHASDVVELLDQLEIETFSLIGHSMGGQLAQWIAAKYPERVDKLVLLCSIPASGLSLSPEIQEHFRNAGGDPVALRRVLESVTLQLSGRDGKPLLDRAMQLSPEAIALTFDAWTQGFETFPGEIQAKTLVIATDDPAVPSELQQREVVEKIPNAHLELLPGVGHYPLQENPAQTVTLISNFFA